MRYLTVDFGSTFTKLTAIDSASGIVGTSSSFTTINTNVMDGFNEALKNLNYNYPDFSYDDLICCSSAAGGLKMIALGLVPELTAKAAKMAASSAGAKVIKTYSFEISKAEKDEIYDINPDLVLLCGGTDGGNKEVIILNALHLCDINRNFSIISAGNKSASYDLEDIFKKHNKEYVITKNVMPTFGKLDIEPAKDAIRELFIKKIIDAKGLHSVQEMTKHSIIPTPLAVLRACELLSKGINGESGIGEFLAVDIGGATTDLYSMSKGKSSDNTVIYKGIPEPYAKRSVEGDLGMRYSIRSLYDESDIDELSSYLNIDKSEIISWVEKCEEYPETVSPLDTKERLIDEGLARCAVEIAAIRHSGVLESFYSPMGEVQTLNGKDLSSVPYIIGTGGVVINSSNPLMILQGGKYSQKFPERMLPKNPKYLLDKRYIFSSMGLLSSVDPNLALKIMKEEIGLIQED